MKYEVDDKGVGASRTRGTSEAEKEEMQRKMEAAGRPGPGHKILESLVGDWNAQVTCWTEPGGSPEVTQGTSKINWILSGRFLEEEFRGQMMGKSFTGKTLMGYDNVKETYTSIWMSDMQTSTFASEGKAAADNKVITFEGKASCPVSGEVRMKTMIRLLGPEKFVFEMFDMRKGPEMKTMEITYSRK